MNRSSNWLDTPELYSWLRKAAFNSQGFNPRSYENKPIIGICNSWSELTHCNQNLRQLAESVKRGIWQAGGFPLEFPVISLGEYHMKPTSMLYRNLMSIDVEESIRANPIDGVVLLSGCDKTTPAMLMGAASANIPSILVTSGPQLSGRWRTEPLGACTDCRRYETEFKAGKINEQEWKEIQNSILRSPGHCMVMGTASTMACLSEILGMALPGNGTIPAVDSRRHQLAEQSGFQIVKMVSENITPSQIMTNKAFENSIIGLHALGGSTNAIIHLTAIAGRLSIDLPLDLFDQFSRNTPVITNLKPSGQFLMEDFHYAGGMQAVIKEISPLLSPEEKSVSGLKISELATFARNDNKAVIKSLDDPIYPEGGLAVLRGSLAPKGAVIKHSAASAKLLNHTGRVIVFDSHDQITDNINSENLDIKDEDILVLKNSGPKGAPGMPEWGFLPIPNKLLKKGTRDMVRISDARMSGTAFGTVVVHVSPESALENSAMAAVKTGDTVKLDVNKRKLELLVEPSEIKNRLKNHTNDNPKKESGYTQLYKKHVLQADEGCDFDFLRNPTK
ncbi:MAG: dihydroxy-acid dehydratase [SAR202 cluster bacterium]|nr:dihydroxy-acid dehydratase [SAR202 cluster bacterium]